MTSPAFAEVTSNQKVKVLLTALSFDKSLKTRSEGKIVIGILGECSAVSSLKEASGKAINGVPIAVEPLGEYKGQDALGDKLKEHKVSVLYVCSIPDDALGAVSSAANKNKALTLADNAAWVQKKFGLGVGEKDGRAELVINVEAARASGAEFDARIFGVARVVE